MELDKQYWDNRYVDNKTGWDIGYANPFLVQIAKQFPKDKRILFPGAGSAYEATVLHQHGYTNIFPLDFSKTAKERFLIENASFNPDQYLCEDFFKLTLEFDVIIEQTFFCAISPSQRSKYVEQVKKILAPKGILAGLFFEMENDDGPPFGGNREEYRRLFSPHFKINKMELSSNSIKPRMGKELEFVFEKR